MRQIAVAILAFAFAASALRAEPDAPTKQSELLLLLRNTNELASFREDVQRMNVEVRKTRPDLPEWYWDELDREVSVDSYARWLIGIYDRAFTEAQARELNAIFGDKQKETMRRELFAALAGKKPGDGFVRAVQDFRSSHGGPITDELITFMQSDAAARYSAMLKEKEAGQKEVTIRLLVEAGHRVSVRHK